MSLTLWMDVPDAVDQVQLEEETGFNPVLARLASSWIDEEVEFVRKSISSLLLFLCSCRMLSRWFETLPSQTIVVNCVLPWLNCATRE